MLLTRCPECDTTFRVTDETLKKASGQVRCGRCASVFNAYAELHDPNAKSFEAEIAPRTLEPTPPPAAPFAPADVPVKSATADAAADHIGTASAADVVAEAEVANVAADTAAIADAADAADAADDERPEAQIDAGAISATEVERVLSSNIGPPLPQSAYAWPVPRTNDGRSRTALWASAAVLALLVLIGQAAHHFRSDIVRHPTFGPLLTQLYAAFGSELEPTWNVRQYQIVDWVATAEPNARGLGSLKITARIRNRGPQRQPYPAVQLRLKDRWEEAVGSRLFTPAEYLPRDTPRGRLMSPGETTRAEIEVVDPGPDAYGFELDVCIEVEASLVTCGTDEVFL